MTLTSSTRRSGTEPTSTQVTSLNELDYLDVFDFFNYPKVAVPAALAMSNNSNHQTNLGHAQTLSGLPGETVRNNGMPDPESDWLGFTSPFT